jgi:ring-1,2-phenylacetyl-CoA epoxidase subunit PaaC
MTELTNELRAALDALLLSMADDEFVIGFSDSEWTGIAPMLEEDVAMSSIAQDELGHARALYELLAALRIDGHDADAIAYDREADNYRHCRLLDHGRGDWAQTVVRRFLYDTADAVRLEALAESSYTPLSELIGKIRREERYHVMHARAWFERLAAHQGQPRRRLEEALDLLGADAGTVFSDLPGEALLVDSGILAAPMAELHERWQADLGSIAEGSGLSLPSMTPDSRGRQSHSDAFRWLWGEFTSVRRLDPVATW